MLCLESMERFEATGLAQSLHHTEVCPGIAASLGNLV